MLHERLAEASPAHAHQWYDGLIASIESLHSFPRRCPVVYRHALSAEPIRQLEYGRRPHVVRVYFRIRGDVVDVLLIRHRARRPLAGSDIAS